MISKQNIYSIYNFLILSFCFIIPFEEKAKAIPNILIAVTAFVWLFIITKKKLIKTVKSKAFIFFTAFLLYITFNSLLKGQFLNDFYVLRKFAIPFAVILLAVPIKNIELIKKVFVLSTLLAVLVSLFNILNYIYIQEAFQFSLGGMINELLISERLYIGFCSVISLVFLMEMFKKSNNKSSNVTIIIIGVLLISFVFLIAARIAIISIVWILILLIATQLSFKNKIIASLSLIIFISVFFTFNQNLTKRFFRLDDKYRKTFFDKVATHEPRIIIWSCSMKIVKNKHEFVFGNGFKNIENQLIACYKEDIDIQHKREWFVNSAFNSHNQYLGLLLGSGFIGLLLFLLMLYYTYAQSDKDFYAMALISSLLLILLVDNIFHRQIGDYIFSILFIVLASIKPKLDT